MSPLLIQCVIHYPGVAMILHCFFIWSFFLNIILGLEGGLVGRVEGLSLDTCNPFEFGHCSTSVRLVFLPEM